MKKFFKVFMLIVIAVLWMCVIFKLSGMNAANSGSQSKQFIYHFIEDAIDFTNGQGYTDYNPTEGHIERVSEFLNIPLRKLCHASVYFILCIFVFKLVVIFFNHNRYFLSLVITLGFCILYAVFDEFHQTFVPGRCGEISDVVIDGCGALVGAIVYTTYYIAYELGFKHGQGGKE